MSGRTSGWLAWTPSQSTGCPSEIVAAMSSRTSCSSSSFIVFSHDSAQMSQSTCHEEPRGAGRRRSDCLGDLAITKPQIQTQDDGLPLILGELTQPRFVAVQALASDHFLERRAGARAKVVAQALVLWTSLRAPGLVPDLVEKNLAEIREERAFAARLEGIQA